MFLCSVFRVWLQEEATKKKSSWRGVGGEGAAACIGCPCICCFVLDFSCLLPLFVLLVSMSQCCSWKGCGCKRRQP